MRRQDFATEAAPAAGHRRRSLLWRILDAAARARQREMEREIEHLIIRSGGHLSDEVERRITEYLTRNSHL